MIESVTVKDIKLKKCLSSESTDIHRQLQQTFNLHDDCIKWKQRIKLLLPLNTVFYTHVYQVTPNKSCTACSTSLTVNIDWGIWYAINDILSINKFVYKIHSFH